MSDELEFQIDDDDNRMESYYFETANGAPGNVRDRSGRGQGILDLEDGDEEGGSRESAENARPLKRGSTQATAAGDGGFLQKNSSEQEAKFTSPFMQSI